MDAAGGFEIRGLPDGEYWIGAADQSTVWRDIGEIFDVFSKQGRLVEVKNRVAGPVALTMWNGR